MTGGEHEEERRQAHERAQSLRFTTDLDEDEAVAVAWKEMGFAAPTIARERRAARERRNPSAGVKINVLDRRR